ncbi:threonylcarbamoyl-AMP synthase [Adelges cooleyi]|uniref:threonylcarbamoyl-AMP synthase n=1 Tax=Adelges cooleyi TaxID=133065 RepID=UPI00217F5EB5|nr:threonylcarbamoyl-AMP synthase [Adelges cooleyi]
MFRPDLVHLRYLCCRTIYYHLTYYKRQSKFFHSKPQEILMNKLIELNEKSRLQAISLAVRLIANGCVIALPTDTVYGLATDVHNSSAISKLYNVKGRDPSKPIAICTHNVNDIGNWGKTDHLPYGLLDAILPGPVTVVLDRTEILNSDLNPGETKVAIRVPDSGFICDIVSYHKKPITLTSANESNKTSTLKPEEFSTLWPKIDAIFDGGPIGSSSLSRLGSTIVDLSTPNHFSILRDGSALLPTVHVLNSFGLRHL